MRHKRHLKSQLLVEKDSGKVRRMVQVVVEGSSLEKQFDNVASFQPKSGLERECELLIVPSAVAQSFADVPRIAPEEDGQVVGSALLLHSGESKVVGAVDGDGKDARDGIHGVAVVELNQIERDRVANVGERAGPRHVESDGRRRFDVHHSDSGLESFALAIFK